MSRFCKCGHSQGSHHHRSGKCLHPLICECTEFQRGARLIIPQPKSRDEIRAELDLLAQRTRPTPEDELIGQVFAAVAPHTHLRVWPSGEGVSVEYFVQSGKQGSQLDRVAGRTLADCLRQIVKHVT